MFVNPTVPEPSPACVDKGKGSIGGEVIAAAEPIKSTQMLSLWHYWSHPTQLSTVASLEAEGQEDKAKE